jgi:hypothetical protein
MRAAMVEKENKHTYDIPPLILIYILQKSWLILKYQRLQQSIRYVHKFLWTI